jgi:sRNA-binding protein
MSEAARKARRDNAKAVIALLAESWPKCFAVYEQAPAAEAAH